MDGITPVMSVDGARSASGFDGFMGIFAIFAIIALLGGGLWGGNRNGGDGGGAASLTEALNLANGQQTAQLEAAANQRQNCMDFVTTNNNINGGFANLSRDICTLGTSLASSIYGSTSDIKDRLSTLASSQAEGFCAIQRGIDGINYNNALNTASINANTTAAAQKILDALCADKYAAAQERINKLELTQALSGVVRYPTTATFNAGYPFAFGTGCGCGI